MLELRQLRYFVAVAEAEHVGRAAERLHLSQSPLSRQIQQLESQLDVVLFERIKKRVRLTEAGRQFLAEARALLAGAEAAVGRTRQFAAGETGTLTIGFVDGAVHGGILQGALNRLNAAYPGIRVELVELRSEPQKDALRRGDLDVGLLYTPPAADDPVLAASLIREEPLVLALPRQHPLAQVGDIRPEDLNGMPWIALPRAIDAAARDRFLAICRAAGFMPDIRFEAASVITVLGLVGGGLGIAFVQSGARWMAPDKVILRDLPWFSLSVRVHLVWPRTARRATVQRFLTMFGEPIQEC